MDRKAVSPVIAIVLLLMMTVAAAGAAYFWLTSMQSRMQKRSTKSIENIMQKSGRRLIAQAAICEPTAPEGMVAWWEFHEGEGNKTHDSSGNKNTGTLYPGSDGEITTDMGMWIDGKAGKALEFDGNDSYVSLQKVMEGNQTSFSWTTWIKMPSQVPSGTGRGALKHRADWHDVSFFVADTQEIWFTIYDSNEDTHQVKSSTLNPGRWYHVIAQYNSPTQKIALYTEEGKVSSNTISWTGKVDFDTGYFGTYIGAYAYNNETYFNGTIDEVRIYDRALSAEEINETYKGKMKVRITVRNVGSVKIPKAKFVANLKKDGTTVDSDTYTTTSSIDTGDLKTLTFYFNEMRPGGEYNINIPGIDVSQTVNCQSLED